MEIVSQVGHYHEKSDFWKTKQNKRIVVTMDDAPSKSQNWCSVSLQIYLDIYSVNHDWYFSDFFVSNALVLLLIKTAWAYLPYLLYKIHAFWSDCFIIFHELHVIFDIYNANVS